MGRRMQGIIYLYLLYDKCDNYTQNEKRWNTSKLDEVISFIIILL